MSTADIATDDEDDAVVFSVESGRAVYVDHSTQTTGWVPDRERWNCLFGLPYGWEIAIDTHGQLYFINHLEQRTTYLDPRRARLDDSLSGFSNISEFETAANRIPDNHPSTSTAAVEGVATCSPELTDEGLLVPLEGDDQSISTLVDVQPRSVQIRRHPQLGFGFVAGSERPVIIRFVTEGGPSADVLLPCDEILTVNDEDVSDAPKERVVNLIRRCSATVRLTVCQPRPSDDQRDLKSSILTATKRARLRHQPSRVRFAEGVFIGPPLDTPQTSESCVPFMPNVMRVFLENGQTRSFKYDNNTTVQDVIESLEIKLALKSGKHFSLCLEHPQGPRSNKISLLNREELLVKIASRPGSQHFRCLFRITFVPSMLIDLYKADPVAFEYYYRQCVNDVVAGRFAYEMRYESCVRLAALQMQQIAVDTQLATSNSKTLLKLVEKEYGLATFLPSILLDNVKAKEVRKHLRFYVKRDMMVSRSSSVPVPPSTLLSSNNVDFAKNEVHVRCASDVQQQYYQLLPPSIEIRMKYVQVLAQMPTFGGRSFSVAFQETKTDMLLEIHPRLGIQVKHPGRINDSAVIIGFELISELSSIPENDLVAVLSIGLKNDDNQALKFLVDAEDLNDLVQFAKGYYTLLLNVELKCNIVDMSRDTEIQGYGDDDIPTVPPYRGLHKVQAAGWNYVDAVSGDDECATVSTTTTDTAVVTTAVEQEEEEAEGVDTERQYLPCRLVDLSRGPPSYQHVVVSITNLPPSSPEDLAAIQESATVDDTVAAESPGPKVDDRRAIRFEDDLLVSHSPPPTKRPSADLSDDVVPPLLSPATRKRIRPLGQQPMEDYVPRTFLRAKDSFVLRQSDKPTKFLKARDSMLLANSNVYNSVKESLVKRSFSEESTESQHSSVDVDDDGDEQRLVAVGTAEPVTDASVQHLDVSSSDTESGLSTPCQSPIHRSVAGVVSKARPQQLVGGTIAIGGVTPTADGERNNTSFGLKSPDDLPLSNISEKDLQEIVHNCQLEGPALEDLLLLFPDNFCTDADIIDLTAVPSPCETPGEESVDTWSSFIPPPTPFRDGPANASSVGQPLSSATNTQIMNRLTKGDFSVIGGNIISDNPHRSHTVTPASVAFAEDRLRLRAGGALATTSAPATDKRRLSAFRTAGRPPSSENDDRTTKSSVHEFIARTVIPPPPSTSSDNENSPRKKSVRFSAELRSLDTTSGWETREHLTSNGGRRRRCFSVDASPCRSPADHHRLYAVAGTSTTLKPSSPERRFLLQEMKRLRAVGNPCADKRHSVTGVYKVQQPTKAPGQSASSCVRRVSLKDYSGLEETEEEKPIIHRISLKEFQGLEVLERGIASIELKRNRSRTGSTGSDDGSLGGDASTSGPGHYARIRSVDVLTEGEQSSATSSPLKHKGSSSSQQSVVLNAITEVSPVSPNESEAAVAASPAGAHASTSPKHSRHGSLIDSFSSRRSRGSGEYSTSATQVTGSSDDRVKAVGNGCLPNAPSSDDTGPPPGVNAAKQKIDSMLKRLSGVVERLPSRLSKSETCQSATLDQLKSNLLSESQQLASATKLLVRGVTEGGGVAQCLHRNVVEAERMTSAAEALLLQGRSLFKNQVLAAKVKEVLSSLRDAVDSLEDACGKGLGASETKRFVRHSTTLAATLTQLIQAVKDA